MKKLLAISALLLLTGAGCVSQNTKNTPTSPVACTMEAKQCPDGSYVGRTGPKCEFSACPNAIQTQTYKDWKTIRVGEIVSFLIPPNCSGDPGAGSVYINCPTAGDNSPTPEFVFSSDGIQVNVRRWENKQSPYWNDMLASMKIIQPLNRTIQINIDK
jgi:hypothetical protein